MNRAAAYKLGATLAMRKHAAPDEDINKRHLSALRTLLLPPLGLAAGTVGGGLAGAKLAPLMGKGLKGLGRLATRASKKNLLLPLAMGGSALGGIGGFLAPLMAGGEDWASRKK